ncbi:Predicted dehydrogenase [Marinococcus luteus]|uniref:Predicted dehydrogenase n=1 Tax=Marinococcus luteus TaxID=1122204 RepID=A0A1H2U993_9BACI|nr:Gfo/Idh/MocA family oxidoreductase [Marinococcus luteus]SDW52517.1 Predicted dehydrogenase [Marinococcus luteus]
MTNNNYFQQNFYSEYLKPKDKYVFSKAEPEFRFNVIGAGMIGMEHIRVTMLEGRAAIHGVYDLDQSSAEWTKEAFEKEFDYTLHLYNSLEEACFDPGVDGLIICTPNYTHLEVMKTAVQSGKHILLEKPMATTIPDVLAIQELVKDYKSVFQIGLQYRHKPIYDEALYEILQKRSLGEVKNISLMEHRVPFLDKVDQWNKFSKFSGGTLVEKCCHYFDLMNVVADSKPVSVYASGSLAVNYHDFEYEGESSDIIDQAFVTVEYENGIKGNFNLCMFAPMFYEEMTVCGNKGRIKTYENDDFLPSNRANTHFEILTGENGTSKVSTPMYPAIIQNSGHHGGTYYEHKYFVDNIKGDHKNTATVAEGFWSIVVGVAAEESIKHNAVINIDELLSQSKQMAE